jgi:hypothetical protein
VKNTYFCILCNTFSYFPIRADRDTTVIIANRYGLDGLGNRIPVGGEIFRSRPDRPWGPASILYNGYRVITLGIKRPGRGVDYPPLSSSEIKEREDLYLYDPSGTSWPVVGCTLPLH